ncbi:hypothetical protein [Pseudomonas sp. MS19]|uniref:hypothetical protein n=1 Tax=Pseudomonas sp. MS19 TaxID=2579939 RepID=UPI001561FF13|nr:hypothetical protein [Pseudomonas sp. MS19]NRH29984.1 hypothetical protein [Pseudomonas sp. MS19]
MKERFTLRIKQYLLNRIIDEAAEQRLTKHTFFERLKGDCVQVMGIEVLENPVTHPEQRIAQAFNERRRIAFDLARTLLLIRSVNVPTVIPSNDPGGDSHVWVSVCKATKVGRVYRRLPAFLQLWLLGLVLTGRKFASTLQRFKWVMGGVSFAVLSAKVWHSGLIDKTWIGISAAAGIFSVWLLSLWK